MLFLNQKLFRSEYLKCTLDARTPESQRRKDEGRGGGGRGEGSRRRTEEERGEMSLELEGTGSAVSITFRTSLLPPLAFSLPSSRIKLSLETQRLP